jgi:hypothetical protein
MFSWKKYLIVFLITCSIFAVAWYVSAYFNERRISELREIQNKISTDILSSETKFAQLDEVSCDNIDNTTLSNELAELANKITYGEESVNDKAQIDMLKNQYTILEVKDFLLNKRIADRCNKPIATILYFYTDKDHCPDCVKQSYVLDALRGRYKNVRVYSFDYDLDLSTVKALRTIYDVTDTLPAVVIDGVTHSGFTSLDRMIEALPKDITPAVSAKK